MPRCTSSNADKSTDESRYPSRFKATIMWNSVLKAFRNQMTVKRHRRLLFFYENSFTGKEAVDFFMAELPKFCTEKKEFSRILLAKFADAGLFISVRGSRGDDKDVFKETEIYRFSDIPLEKIATTPVVTRRAASFNARSSSSYSRRFLDAAYRQQHFYSNLDDAFCFDEKLSRSSLLKSRRISLSYGNLPEIINHVANVANSEDWTSAEQLSISHEHLRRSASDSNGNKENDNSCKKHSGAVPVDIPALSARLFADLALYPSKLRQDADFRQDSL
uniref:DEP domain-containing protein n=1 Tax=Syphacia muris TaxID=451379 RepID=A0A158R4W2_9BILA